MIRIGSWVQERVKVIVHLGLVGKDPLVGYRVIERERLTGDSLYGSRS